MSYARICVLLLLSQLLFQAGCCRNRVCNVRPCADVVSDVRMLPSSNAVPGVTEDFSQVTGFAAAQTGANRTVTAIRVLSLEDTLCVAAQNARTAGLLQSQLKRLNNIQDAKCPGSLNLAIRAQIANERSQAASLAGQAFLGLVEVDLQRNLLIEAQQRLAEINLTIKEAAKNGFATADAKEVLEQQSVKIAKQESELNFNSEKLKAQLKTLLGLPTTEDIELSYHLNPSPLKLDSETEFTKAMENRAELVALRTTLAQWNSCSSESAKAILSAVDPRMGLELAKAVACSRWPLLSLIRSQRNPVIDHCENPALRQQTEKLLQDSEEAVKLQVEEAILETQFAYESMTLADEDIRRLENQIDRIRAKKDLDATGAYVDLQNNWYETLLARSERLNQAISFESGQIRLAHANGELLLICGSQIEVDYQDGL